MEFRSTKTWACIKTVYWMLVFCASALFYWLIFSTLF